VLDQSGVRYLIVFEGVNDIGEEGHEAETAEELIQAYRLFIEKAHEQGILVYGATILPFGGSQYDNKENEETRLKVNHWIRNSGAFDAVLDFAAAVEDPEEPGKLYNLYDCGDHLHLSPAGYKKLAETIDLALFRTENR
ncbi:MAG: GDSL-type esterase/lipase family protein, partial [Halanaerobiales bacterium]